MIETFALVVPPLLLVLLTPSVASAQRTGRCPDGKSQNGAMRLSSAHPRVREYLPKGALQVECARDVRRCDTNDSVRWDNR